ncbi:hypothetical protein CkaCkLH20_06093 [Colletotrichum karsti]|uniref:DUF427 domain-containing protein n=1 Tax=Colletotrichum karsti TaxID=1095194 RepID=A0A9P6IDH8_9PEZI|nr:uncharacterized protein CkaCkLH20_06093 [Colletotrichum karsti]KAF9876685.1 hypothetical protein CkaCkLH20_06093 [Colletotrichum karsti]
MSKPGQFRADLPELARNLLKDGPQRVRPTDRRIRVLLNHTYIVDTTKAVHVWEHIAYPQYYVPTSELRNCIRKDKESIHTADDTSASPAAAVVELTIAARDGVKEFTTDRVLRFSDDPKIGGALSGMIRLEFGSMGKTEMMLETYDSTTDIFLDQWLEEEVPIYVHPKDPFKRIDILPSTRSVEVKIAGKTVAKTTNSVHLHETYLPARYYVPLSSVDQTVLRKSELVTSCPYKGDAEYYNIVINGEEFKDLVWYYKVPTHESANIAGLLCFYNEKVDIILDGELLDRPKTFFS